MEPVGHDTPARLTRRAAWARAANAVAMTYGACLGLGWVGAVIGGAFPPTTRGWDVLGWTLVGSMGGGLLGLLVAGWQTRRLGMRPWFLPLTLGLGVVAYGLGSLNLAYTIVGLAVAPLIAGLASVPAAAPIAPTAS